MRTIARRGHRSDATAGEADDSFAAADRPPSGPRRWQVVALVGALCFLSGVVGWAIGRPAEESFNDVDVGFLSDMAVHHGGAIAMSFNYLDRDNDPLTAHFAHEIVVSQAQEVAIMNQLLGAAGNPSTASDDVAMDWMGMAVPSSAMPGMPTEREVAELRAATGLAADEVFTRLMIRHHAAGIAMAEYTVEHGKNAKVRNLAASMARVQRSEINELSSRRRALGLSSVDVSEFEALGTMHSR